MLDWFTWNGVDCRDYGIHVLQQPTYFRAKERVENITIPGRSGALTRLEGDDVYDNQQLTCTCIIHNSEDNRVENINSWLRGNGKLVFATRQNGFFKGRLNSQLQYAQLVRGNPHLSFQLQFDCAPYFFLNSGETPMTYERPANLSDSRWIVSIENLGTVPSQPLIKVTGTGDGDIWCGTQEVSLLSVDTTKYGYVVLDSDAKVAYTGEIGSAVQPLEMVGTHVQGAWIELPTGTSQLILSSSITSIVLTPRWRCL